MGSRETPWLCGTGSGIKIANFKRIYISIIIGLSILTILSTIFISDAFSSTREQIRLFLNSPQTSRFTVTHDVGGRDLDNHVTLRPELSMGQELQYPVPPVVNKIDDILSMPKIQFDSRFKNPCWFEKIREPGCLNDTSTEQCTLLRCLPYFYIIGMCKSGTTDLFHRLTKHPDVLRNSGALGKETLWWPYLRLGTFTFSDNVQARSFRHYLRVFDEPAKQIFNHSRLSTTKSKNKQLITGEGSPPSFYNLIHWERIPQNDGLTFPKYTAIDCLAHLQPDAKLILILRNPTERLYADYLFHFGELKKRDKKDAVKSPKHFHHKVVAEIDTFNQCVKRTSSVKACLFDAKLHFKAKVRLYTNFYSVYMEEWLKVFPRKNIFIMRTEDYSVHTRGYLAELLVFLNLRLSDEILDEMSTGQRKYQRKKSDTELGPMLEKTRNVLDKFYEKYNNDLAILLGDDRYKWS